MRWLLLCLLFAACTPSGGGDDDDGADWEHDPVTVADEGVPVPIDARWLGADAALRVWHRAPGGDWASTELARDGDAVIGAIPAEAVSGRGLDYYLDADGALAPADGPDAPWSVAVQPRPLGDVAPLRAFWDGGALQITWSAPGTDAVQGWAVTADGATVCEGDDRAADCELADPAWGVAPHDFTLTVTSLAGESATATATTDGLRLFVDAWGKEVVGGELPFGDGVGEFNLPWAATLAGTRIYVVDQNNARVQSFTLDGTHQVDSGTGAPGDDPGQLNAPADAVIGPDGLLYVADYANGRVSVFQPGNGAFQRSFGTLGLAEGQLRFPVGLAFDPDGYLHVLESTNARVSRWDVSVTPPVFVDTWDTVEGAALVAPTRLDWLDALGAFAVADGDSLRLRAWAGEDATWSFDAQVSGACETTGGDVVVGLDDPAGTANSDGHLLVQLRGGAEVARYGGWGTGAGQLWRPVDVACAADGGLYVVDALNHRIQRWGR